MDSNNSLSTTLIAKGINTIVEIHSWICLKYKDNKYFEVVYLLWFSSPAPINVRSFQPAPSSPQLFWIWMRAEDWNEGRSVSGADQTL